MYRKNRRADKRSQGIYGGKSIIEGESSGNTKDRFGSAKAAAYLSEICRRLDKIGER